jgi:hypothetical protein
VIAEAERVFKEKGIECVSVELGEGYDPSSLPENAQGCFLDPKYQAVIIGTRENIWHTPERRIAKKDMGKRLANLIHPATQPVPSFFTEPGKYARIGKILDEIMRKGKQWRIKAPGGTDLNGGFPVDQKGFFFEQGDYSTGGKGGDFPSGEVGFGPQDGSVEGNIAFDIKVQHIGNPATPIRIAVNGDRIRVLSDDEVSRRYARLIGRDPVLSLISEISFGINPDWSESDNAMSIIEEKNLGTAHFGHGGNWSYGNRKGPHFDAVIDQPDLIIDDELILSRGELVFRDQERQ